MGLNRGAITLLVAALFYCYASGAEVLLVKLMNARPEVGGAGVLLPLGTALLLNGYWPIQLVMYRFVLAKTASPRPLTWKHVRGYAIIGTMAAAVSGLRCVGINYMPGSVYVIISTADLPLNTMLSRLVLKKEFTVMQYVAVLCAMSGILVCLVESGDDAPEDHPCDGDSCIDDWGVYILASLLSAFFSACNSVLGEFLLSKDKKNPLLAVCEVSFFNSFIPFCVISVFLVATQWWKACDDPCNSCARSDGTFCGDDHDQCALVEPGCASNDWCVNPSPAQPAGEKLHTCYTHLRPWGVIHDYITRPDGNGHTLTVLFCGVAFGLCISKMVDRIAKFYIVALQGAFFFALLDTFRRLATAIVAVFAFNEALTVSKVCALMLSILAIFLHSYSSHKKNIEKNQLQLFQSFVAPPTFEEEQERLRQRYASVRGLPDDATWDDIEAHDAEARKGSGVSRFSVALQDTADDSPADKVAGDGIGANLLGDDSGGRVNRSAEQGVWEFLGLDFLLEASSEVRVMRGATVEDADIVAAAGSRGSRAGVLGTGTFGAIGRMTRSGLTAEEDLDQAFDVAFNNYN